MTGAMIAQLVLQLGPVALQLIQDLIGVWNKELTVDEVTAICAKAQKSYDAYIEEAKAALTPPTVPTPVPVPPTPAPPKPVADAPAPME